MTTSIHDIHKPRSALPTPAAPSSALASSTLILVHTSAPITNRQDENFRSFVRNYAEFTGRKRHVVHVSENEKGKKGISGHRRQNSNVVIGSRTPVSGRYVSDDVIRRGERNVHKRERMPAQSDGLELDDEEIDDRRKRQRFDDAIHSDSADVEVVGSPVYHPMPVFTPYAQDMVSPISSEMADVSMIPSSLVFETAVDHLETPSRQDHMNLCQTMVPNTEFPKSCGSTNFTSETYSYRARYQTPSPRIDGQGHMAIAMIPNTVFAEPSIDIGDPTLTIDEFSCLSMESSEEIPDSQPSPPPEMRESRTQQSSVCISPIHNGSFSESLEGFSPVSPLSVRLTQEGVVSTQFGQSDVKTRLSMTSEISFSSSYISGLTSPLPTPTSTPTPSPSKHSNCKNNVRVMTDYVAAEMSERASRDDHNQLPPPEILPQLEPPQRYHPQLGTEVFSEPALIESSPNKHSNKKLPKFSLPIQLPLLSLVIQQSTGILHNHQSLKQHIKKYSLRDYYIYPPFSKINPKLSRITPRMSAIYKSANPQKYYSPKKMTPPSRPVLPSERGYWRLDLGLWPKKADTKAEKCATVEQKLDFWKKLREYVMAGKLGDVKVEFEDEAEGAGASLGDVIRVYCFGEALVHIWIILFVTSGRMTASMQMKWIDGMDEVRITT